MTIIYGLFDPRDCLVAYVGKTALPLYVRFSNHPSEAKTGSNKRCLWIRSLKESGVDPGIGVIEVVDDDEWDEAERTWIEHFWSVGQAFANTYPGGQSGRPGGWTCSPEHRQKISLSLKGRLPCAASLSNLSIWRDSHADGWYSAKSKAARKQEAENRLERNKKVCNAYSSGGSMQEVGKEFGLSIASVHRIIRLGGTPSRRCGPRFTEVKK